MEFLYEYINELDINFEDYFNMYKFENDINDAFHFFYRWLRLFMINRIDDRFWYYYIHILDRIKLIFSLIL